MRIDVSSDSFDISKGYTRVLLQQGRPILDRDWNEHGAIIQNQLRTVVRSIYGPHGGPAGTECGFIPVVDPNGITLRNGWYTIDGFVLSCHGKDGQPVKYRNQDGFDPGDMDQSKKYLIYLEAMEREVTAAIQPELLEAGLPGVDMAARGQLVWRVKHEVLDTGNSCENATRMVSEWLDAKREEQEDPRTPLAESQFEDLGDLVKNSVNQLCRIECHDSETWKVSTSNGFALFQIEKVDGNQVTVRLGALETWAPQTAPDVVELLTEQNLKFNEPGQLFELEKGDRPRPPESTTIDRRTIALDKAVEPLRKFVFLRVWNRTVSLKVLGAKVGDHWQFAVREPDQNLKDNPLKRIKRQYAPLALVETDEKARPTVISYLQRVIQMPWREVSEEYDLGPRTAMARKSIIGIIGGGTPTIDVQRAAESLGYAIAVNGAVLLTGGQPDAGESVKSLAMCGAARAAQDGKTLARLIGVLTLNDDGKSLPNIQGRYQRLIKTKLTSYERNPINGFTPDAVLVLRGEVGTLAELGFALAAEKPCYFVGSTQPLRDFLDRKRSKVEEAIQTGLDRYPKGTHTKESIAKNLEEYLNSKEDDLALPKDDLASPVAMSAAEVLVKTILQEINHRGGLEGGTSGFPGIPGVLSKQSFENWLNAMP